MEKPYQSTVFPRAIRTGRIFAVSFRNMPKWRSVVGCILYSRAAPIERHDSMQRLDRRQILSSINLGAIGISIIDGVENVERAAILCNPSIHLGRDPPRRAKLRASFAVAVSYPNVSSITEFHWRSKLAEFTRVCPTFLARIAYQLTTRARVRLAGEPSRSIRRIRI